VPAGTASAGTSKHASIAFVHDQAHWRVPAGTASAGTSKHASTLATGRHDEGNAATARATIGLEGPNDLQVREALRGRTRDGHERAARPFAESSDIA